VWRIAACCAILAAPMVGGLSGDTLPGSHQPPSNAQVIGYLLQSVNWYRHVYAERQVATEPADLMDNIFIPAGGSATATFEVERNGKISVLHPSLDACDHHAARRAPRRRPLKSWELRPESSDRGFFQQPMLASRVHSRGSAESATPAQPRRRLLRRIAICMSAKIIDDPNRHAVLICGRRERRSSGRTRIRVKTGRVRDSKAYAAPR